MNERLKNSSSLEYLEMTMGLYFFHVVMHGVLGPTTTLITCPVRGSAVFFHSIRRISASAPDLSFARPDPTAEPVKRRGVRDLPRIYCPEPSCWGLVESTDFLDFSPI